jgi:hypothetical protein
VKLRLLHWVALALLALPGSAGRALAQTPAGPEAVFQALQATWEARDREGYLALWQFPDEATRADEIDFVASRLTEGTSRLTLQRPARAAADSTWRIGAQIFSTVEPRARVEQVLFHLAYREGAWRVVRRDLVGSIDGLVHLALEPKPFRADGLAIHLEDFQLDMTRGTLFLSPQAVGPTVLVFVGEGTVRIKPRPVDEREQLRQYSGRPELTERVTSFFLRLHPGDLHRVLSPMRLTPQPEGLARLTAAQRLYREQVSEAYVLDTLLPGSPWWLLPSLGDALITFQARGNLLTYAVSHNEPEGISLFDRARHRQILLYPVEGKTTEYDEDEGRAIDVLSHDLSVRFSPARAYLEGEDTIQMRLLSANPTVRLRLHESLNVSSVRSAEGGEHLFFRVRHQDSIMVSLGSLAGREGPVSVTVRYSGTHRPDEVDREVMQVREDPNSMGSAEPDVVIDDVLVYSNRTAWYPQGASDDHAVAKLHFEVPASHLAVAGGTRTAFRVEGDKRILEFSQDVPGKYITAVVGRLFEVATADAAGLPLVGYSVGRARTAVPETLDSAKRILEFMRGEFGPIPFTSLNVVVIEGKAPGGHSPPGMVVLSRRPPLLRQALRDDPASFQDLPEFFLAHELAHQWWGHGVSGQNYRERWIAEAFAQYAAALWIRKSEGEQTFQNVLARMARWGLRDSEKGPIHLGHRLGHIQGDPQIFRAVVYDKGAYVLHMLHGVVGDEAFRRALTELQQSHHLGKAGTEDVRAALEHASGKNLRSYFQAWVYGTALPTLSTRQRVEGAPGGFRVIVDVATRDLPGPVPLQIAFSQGGRRETRTVTLAPEGGRFTFDSKGRPGRIEVNADRGLLVKTAPWASAR